MKNPSDLKSSGALLLLAGMVAAWPTFLVVVQLSVAGKVDHWWTIINWGLLAVYIALAAAYVEYKDRKRRKRGKVE
jgi:hypothetical protein